MVLLSGLNDIIERRTTDEKGSVKADLVCLLCADQFPVTDFKKHIDNKIHLCQFVVSRSIVYTGSL